MAENRYLFVDGGYLRKIYTKYMNDFFGVDGEINLLLVKNSASAVRAYYYDCLDDIQKSDESEADFRARVKRQDDFFNEIRSLSGYHVRLGTLSGTPGKLRQKEVDVLLAVDMLTHGFYRNMSQAVLLAGDLDFKPIVDSLVQHGTYVHVLYERHTAARTLYWAADVGEEIAFHTLYNWSTTDFRDTHPIPGGGRSNSARPTNLHVIKKGIAADGSITLFRKGRGYLLFADACPPRMSLTLEFDDLEKLEEYFELEFGRMYGPIQWTS